MPYDFLNNNPLLADMSPEKLQFLMNFATAKKPTDIKEMMPFSALCHEFRKIK